MNGTRSELWTIRPAADGEGVEILDQTELPHRLVRRVLRTLEEAAEAIEVMRVRGAPLIGATAAYGVALALREDPSDGALERALVRLGRTRPTAVDLHAALARMARVLRPLAPGDRFRAAMVEAGRLCAESAEMCRRIGEHGLALIEAAARRKRAGEPVHVLTHCNAGRLACIDWGTATAPVYLAHRRGIPVHVWVDETRPRNQGAAITAFELGRAGVPHTVIADNAGGHLMQHGLVDLCLVGADRVTRRGDVANKIGTYLKALAAFDNGVPFYVALPSTTVDWDLWDGVREIPIERRDGAELTRIRGATEDGRILEVRLVPEGSPAANWAFDVTPARYITGFVTERGVCEASESGLLRLFPERAGRGGADGG